MNKIRKISVLVLAFALCALCLAGCSGTSGSTGSQTAQPSANPTAGMTLNEIMEKALDGVEVPSYEITELSADNFEFFTFIPMIEGATAVSADGLIGSIAHSVVLVRVPDGTKAEDVAKQIEENANPRKWICVEAEKVTVTAHEDLVLLVMSFTDTTDAITANFDALFK